MKYKVLDHPNTIREVEGNKVFIQGFPDLEVFAHKEENGTWTVTEERTGGAIVFGGETKSKAVKLATDKCIYQVAYTLGEYDIYQLINKNIEMGRGISKVPYENPKIAVSTDTKIRVLIEALTATKKEREEHIKNASKYMSRADTKPYDTRIEALETVIQKY